MSLLRTLRFFPVACTGRSVRAPGAVSAPFPCPDPGPCTVLRAPRVRAPSAPDAHPFLLTLPRRGLSCCSRPSHGTRSTRAPRCRLLPPARSSSCSCGGKQATPLSTARRPWRPVAVTSNRCEEEVLCDLVLRPHPVLSLRGHSGEHRRDPLPRVLSDRTQRGECGVNDSFALRLRFHWEQ